MHINNVVLPRGTHNWAKFITPNEMINECNESNLNNIDLVGLIPELQPPTSAKPDSIIKGWKESKQKIDVNYIAAFYKK